MPSSPYGAVQDGEDDVDPGERARHVARARAPRGRGGSGRRRAPATSPLPSTCGQHAVGDAQTVRVVALEHPAPVGGEADRDDVVAVAVEGAQHRSGRDAGDRVLAGAPTEDDGHSDASGLAHGVNPSGPSAVPPAAFGRLASSRDRAPDARAAAPRDRRRVRGAPGARAGRPRQRAGRTELHLPRRWPGRLRADVEPLVGGVRGRPRPARGRPVPGLRQRDGRGVRRPRPRADGRCRGRVVALVLRHGRAAPRPRGRAAASSCGSCRSTTRTPSPPPARAPRCSGSKRRRTRPSRCATSPQPRPPQRAHGVLTVVRQHLRDAAAAATARSTASTSSCTPPPSRSPATRTCCWAVVVHDRRRLHDRLLRVRTLVGRSRGRSRPGSRCAAAHAGAAAAAGTGIGATSSRRGCRRTRPCANVRYPGLPGDPGISSRPSR